MSAAERSDRRVHAFCVEYEVVRYDRAGKWFIEFGSLEPRRRLTLASAVDAAVETWDHGGSPKMGVPGGGAFDAKLRARYPR